MNELMLNMDENYSVDSVQINNKITLLEFVYNNNNNYIIIIINFFCENNVSSLSHADLSQL